MTKYQKWTPDQDKSRNIIPDGQYRALIDCLTQKMTKGGKIDKKGNATSQLPMLEIDIIIQDDSGRERKIKDWIMLEGDMSWKYRHLATACGLEHEYDTDTLELRMITGKMPVVDLRSRKGQDQSGADVMRNYIFDYLAPAGKAETEFKDNEDIGF